jgi:TolB-like protein/Tfp pilus assembly protein PilF
VQGAPKPREAPQDSRSAQASPARIEIFTLRPFQILVDGEPLRFAGRVQRKPLELLKTLIALGSEGVAESQLCDALWPDAEGEAAHQSLASTLHRLRKLLGPSKLALQDAKLSLNPEICWTDCRAFANLLLEAERLSQAGDTEAALTRMDVALRLYRQPFLEGEFHPPEILVLRERLRGMLLRNVGELGRRLREKGDLEKALNLCQRALEADPASEELCRALMLAQRDLGRQSEAIAAYERCKEILRRQFGIDPSPETEALRRQLLESKAAPMPASRATGSSAPTSVPTPAPPAPAHSEPAEGLRPAIAVLPFSNLSGDPSQEYFSDGFSEEIITQLARIPGLAVMSRYSSFAYKGQSKDAREIGRELGVAYLLEGSVRRAGNRLRITAQLIESGTGRHVWAESFDLEAERLFDVQDQIVEEIAGRLNAQIEREQIERAQRKPPTDLTAHDLLLQSNPLLDGLTEARCQRARQLLERAVELEPCYVPALSMLSFIYQLQYRFRWTPEDDLLERAYTTARKAVDLDPLDARARYSLAGAHFFRHELPQFEMQAARCLTLNPYETLSWAEFANLNAWLGREDEAMRMSDQAIRLNPRHPGGYEFAPAVCHYMNGRYPEALQALLRADLTRFYPFHAWLAAIYAQLGMLVEARAAAAEVRRLKPDFDLAAHYRAYNMPEENIRKLLEGARKAGLV